MVSLTNECQLPSSKHQPVPSLENAGHVMLLLSSLFTPTTLLAVHVLTVDATLDCDLILLTMVSCMLGTNEV